jgi:hypothetical protein
MFASPHFGRFQRVMAREYADCAGRACCCYYRGGLDCYASRNVSTRLAFMTPLITCSRRIFRQSAKPAMTGALWAASIFVFAIIASFNAQAHQHRVDGASVLERGIFRAQSGGAPVGHSTFGPITKVWDFSLVQSTTTIPARKSLRFGLRYVITGAPAGTTVEIKFVTRFPESGLLDPITGVRHHESEYTGRRVIGAPAYLEFRFDRSWEIVSGEWVFEFWHEGQKIGTQKFCVINVESAPHEADLLQTPSCASLIAEVSSAPSDEPAVR